MNWTASLLLTFLFEDMKVQSSLYIPSLLGCTVITQLYTVGSEKDDQINCSLMLLFLFPFTFNSSVEKCVIAHVSLLHCVN